MQRLQRKLQVVVAVLDLVAHALIVVVTLLLVTTFIVLILRELGVDLIQAWKDGRKRTAEIEAFNKMWEKTGQ